MICPKCGKPLPDDSDFCQYCGCRIRENHTDEPRQREPEGKETAFLPGKTLPEQENQAEESGAHVRYCEKCGGQVDRRTKRCRTCGRRSFLLRIPLSVLCLSLLLAAAAGFGVYFYLQYQRLSGGVYRYDPSAIGEMAEPDYHGHWAEEAMEQAIDNGLLQGYGDGTYRPDQYVTRAELAVILKRLEENGH